MKIDQFDRYTHSGREAAAALKIHPSTLCHLAKNPDFPQPLRISRRIVRYDLQAIKRYLLEQGA